MSNTTSNIMSCRGLLPWGLALLVLCPATSWAGKITEPKTGVSFPETRRWGSHRQIAVGIAMKKKFMFKVYAGCLYIEQEPGRRELLELAKAKGLYAGGKINTKKLLQEEYLFDWLISSDLAMTIDLTFVRSFGYSNFKEKYHQRLGLFLKDKKLIERFLTQPSGDITAYGHLTFNLMPGGKVTLQYMGKTFKPITSRSLKRAVLSTFLSSRSSEDQIRTGLVGKIDRLLKVPARP